MVAITVSPAPAVTSAIWSEPKIGMCTVGAPGSNSAMPRLPRVISTDDIRVRFSNARPARSSTLLLSSILTPSYLLDFGLVGVHAVRPRSASARNVSRSGSARAPSRRAKRGRKLGNEARLDEAGAVVGDQHGVSVRSPVSQPAPRRRDAHRSRSRSRIDRCERPVASPMMPPARMRVLTGVRYPPGRVRPARSTDRGSNLNNLPARFVAADERHEPHGSTEARDVVRGIAGAAGNDRGRVVFEDQHRRFARDAGDAAIDEFVGDQIAEHHDTLAAAGRNQGKQSCGVSVPSVALGSMPSVASAIMKDYRDRVNEVVADRVDLWPAGRRCSCSAPQPVRTRIDLAPTA